MNLRSANAHATTANNTTNFIVELQLLVFELYKKIETIAFYSSLCEIFTYVVFCYI